MFIFSFSILHQTIKNHILTQFFTNYESMTSFLLSTCLSVVQNDFSASMSILIDNESSNHSSIFSTYWKCCMIYYISICSWHGNYLRYMCFWHIKIRTILNVFHSRNLFIVMLLPFSNEIEVFIIRPALMFKLLLFYQKNNF